MSKNLGFVLNLNSFSSLVSDYKERILFLQVMQLAGIEAQHVVLLLEDYQFVQPTFLEMVNSLLSSGQKAIIG